MCLLLFISCTNDSIEDSVDSIENNEDDSEDEISAESFDDNESDDDKILNGTYDASVDYYNPKTGYSATYELEVDVEDGEVVRINFPKGGWLDDDIHPSESRLSPVELDENGEATMEDENGKTFEIKIYF